MVYFYVLGSSYFVDNVIWINLIDVLLFFFVRVINYMKIINRELYMIIKNILC